MKQLILSCFLLGALASQAETVALNDNWKFTKGTAPSNIVTLPHSWNGLDGQDGGNDYYRGTGVYEHDFTLGKGDKNKRVYLRFGAANYKADLFVNGDSVGTHSSGYTAFAFDITPFVKQGDNHVLVRVSNAETLPIAPLSADFTFFGGLIRGVELIKKNPLHIVADDHGSRGVFIAQTKVSDSEALLTTTTELRNSGKKACKATVSVTLTDRDGRVVAKNDSEVTVPAGSDLPVVETLQVKTPHLWNGVKDPYLYTASVEVKVGKEEVDSYQCPIGLRYYSIDPNKGFMLNGHSYPLRGVSLHEQRPDVGNALTDAQRRDDVDRMVEMGCNYIRLSHYQHGDFTYNYLDSLGVICWTETPVINKIIDTEEYAQNCEMGLRSLIRQHFNHPSVVVWGVSNEINYKQGPNPMPLIERLNKLVHDEDPTRYSTLAAMHSEKPNNFVPDVYSNNRYDGWYFGEIKGIESFSDKLHAKYPDRCIGISEYGAGAHPYHHTENNRKPDPGGHWHPEGYQTLFHEGYLKAINERPYLWSTSVWAAYDFASDGRNEGNQPGINDKGLVTHDRKIKKDAYYLYKANWNPEPMVYLCERRFVKHTNPETSFKLYSNCDSVTLTLNGEEIPVEKDINNIYRSGKVTLKPGLNRVKATAVKGDTQVEDKMVWFLIEE